MRRRRASQRPPLRQVDAAPDVTAPTQQAPRQRPADRVAALEAELERERDAATDYMQRWQRAQADFTNFAPRTEQERDQQQKLYHAQALAFVLPALDSFERAFATLPETLRGYSWIDGVALVELQLERDATQRGRRAD